MLSSFNVQSIIAAVLVFLLFYSPTTHSTLRRPRTPRPPSGSSWRRFSISHTVSHVPASALSPPFSRRRPRRICGSKVNENGFIKPGK